MMRSLFSAVTGLRNHQTKMDVIGHNIANVNTVAYKPSRVVFQELYSQTLTPASGPSASRGGTNPSQVGLGMTLSTIDVMQTSSSAQYTGQTLDLCINNDGYFVIQNGPDRLFTRAGNFTLDEQGYLVTSDGGFVLGFWTGETDPTTPGADGKVTPPDLDINGTDWTPPASTANPFPDTEFTDLGPIRFDPNYKNVQIDKNGTIVGNHKETNELHVIGQLQTATFENPAGMERMGGNLWANTVNSGDPIVANPGDGSSGILTPGSLEMANVDIAYEFSEMITTQRGFQANSRIITVSDSMLEELVNLKR